MTKLFIYSFATFLIFATLVFYNLNQAQKKLANSQPAIYTIEMLEAPEVVSAKSPVRYRWHVEAPENLVTTATAIYWSQTSTPSALTKYDNPDAVSYANKTKDYSVGEFALPYTFEANLIFDKPGIYFLRAWSRIGDDNLWTKEYKIIAQ